MNEYQNKPNKKHPQVLAAVWTGTRTGHALATIRRLALYLLEKETSHKKGIACKRKTARWDHTYLLKVLNEGQNVRENDRIELKNKK